jgi:hypothetical protein
VKETGNYISAIGEHKMFKKGEIFSVRPSTMSETSWRHYYSEYKTGETVIETGHYYSFLGEHENFMLGEMFTVCPNTSKETSWRHAE